jgi:hypothetical protein
VLRADLDGRELKKLAQAILDLGKEENRETPRIQINEAQACEAVWSNSQCIPAAWDKCPLLIFGKQLADELNYFFHGDDDGDNFTRRGTNRRAAESYEELD